MDKVEFLLEVRDLISDPEHWTRGHNARNGEEWPVHYGDPAAEQFCLRGAALRVAADHRWFDTAPIGWAQGMLPIAKEIERRYGRVYGIPLDLWGLVINFNDSHEHAEVLDVLDEAIRTLKAEA